MPTYAQNTTVAADRSRSEIESTLQRYGADGFIWRPDDLDTIAKVLERGVPGTTTPTFEPCPTCDATVRVDPPDPYAPVPYCSEGCAPVDLFDDGDALRERQGGR